MRHEFGVRILGLVEGEKGKEHVLLIYQRKRWVDERRIGGAEVEKRRIVHQVERRGRWL